MTLKWLGLISIITKDFMLYDWSLTSNPQNNFFCISNVIFMWPIMLSMAILLLMLIASPLFQNSERTFCINVASHFYVQTQNQNQKSKYINRKPKEQNCLYV